MSQPEGNTSIEEMDNDNNKPSSEEPENNYLRLRKLLLGDDYSSAIKRYISKEEEVERVSEVLPQAVKLSTQAELGEALSPVVDKAIEKSIEQNPTRITDILFPIMGPAIRKAVASALAEMVQSLNTLLEKSLTLGSLNWRVRAWRAGMPYAQYVLLQTTQFRVEQVLLVHRETGLLLNSVTAPEVDTQDPELVSSMLTAIGDFVSDSFSAGDETLERVRLGDFEVHLNVGPHAILALAVRGSASDELTLKANTTIEEVHARFGYELNHFEGDRAPFDATTAILSKCLLSQKASPAEKGKPWMAIVLLLFGAAYLVVSGIEHRYIEQQHAILQGSIDKEPGYLSISSESVGDTLYINLLRSPESRSADIVSSEFLENVKSQDRSGWLAHFSWLKSKNIKLIIDDTMVHMGPLPTPIAPPAEQASLVDVEAVTQALLIDGEQVTIIAQGEHLSVKGEVSEATRRRIIEDPTLKQTYGEIDLSGLIINDTTANLNKFLSLVGIINNTVFYFEPNESRLSGDELLKIPATVKTINELEMQAAAINISDLQIIVMGFADRSGSSFGNNTVSQQRADGVRTMLTENAVSADIVVAWGAGNIDLDNISDETQRRVTLQVLYSRQSPELDSRQSPELNSKQNPDLDPTHIPNSGQSIERTIDMDFDTGDSWWVK